MSQLLHVHFLPELIPAASLHGGVAVIIDVLRASSTIVTALGNGASGVIPCGGPRDAQRIGVGLASENVLLGGERHGVRIDGFDLGNSPAEYTTSIVAGRPIIFTTTNGTKALLASCDADVILIGAFLNLTSIVDRILALDRPVHLICAGTHGVITGEDVLFAGAVTARLRAASETTGSFTWTINDSAAIAEHHWQQVLAAGGGDKPLADCLSAALRETHGGRNLIELTFDRDLELCSRIDAVRIVPQFQTATGTISVEHEAGTPATGGQS